MRMIIENTNKPLSGKIYINGSKNAALTIIAACILSRRPITLRNVPYIDDIIGMVEILKSIGAKAEFHFSDHDGNHLLEINCSKIFTSIVAADLAKKLRASILLIGPLVARFGKTEIGFPGGCLIGERRVDIHQMGFQQLGAKLEIGTNAFHVKTDSDKLEGTEIAFPFPSVGATENILMASVLADGITVIKNAATEPDVTDLANFLVSMGARITGIGTRELTIVGVKELYSCEYTIIPDRHEAGTYALAGIITRGNLELVGVQIEHILPILEYLRILGATVINNTKSNSVTIKSRQDIFIPSSLEFVTQAHPGFPTDMQPQLCTVLCLSNGNQYQYISETIFENRFSYTKQLKEMGANIESINPKQIRILGVKSLKSGIVYGSDLRATAALVLAGLVAKGNSPTIIENVDVLLRGYEKLHTKLNNCGASIRIEN